MLECVVIVSFKTDVFLRVKFFISLITWTLKVSSSSLKGKRFLLVSESNSGQDFRCSWTPLSSWVDWIERWCNAESLGRDQHSRLLMILYFINCFSIKLSSFLLKRFLQFSLHKVSFNSFETSSLPHFLFPRFNVLTDATISVSSAFPSINPEFRQSSVDGVTLQCYYFIYQCIRILNQISISNRRKFVGGSQILPIWNWQVNNDINGNSVSLLMHLSWCVIVNHMMRSKWNKASRIIFFLSVTFPKKTSLIPTFFPVTLIYDTNKIYPGNPHSMLCPFV